MKPKISVIGEPYEKRKELIDKLSRFLSIPSIKLEDILKPEEIENDDIIRFKLNILAEENENGFILDGFPIDDEDFDLIDLDLTIFFNVKENEAIEHNTKRRTCPTCFRLYHLIDFPPIKEGLCDRCGSKIEQSIEDTEESIRTDIIHWYKAYKKIRDKCKKDSKLLDVFNDYDISNIASKALKMIKNKKSFKDKRNVRL